MVSENKEVVVVKSNRLIEACYRLDLMQLRIIMIAIMVSRERDVFCHGVDHDECKPFKIHASQFLEYYPLAEKSLYAQLKEAVKGINRKPITSIEMIEGEECQIEVPWFSKAAYMLKQGSIQLEFNKHVIPYIARIENQFTEYRLAKIGRLTSAHAVRLYEILFQYLKAGKRDIEIDWLKKTLMIEDEYKLIAELKRRVIDPSVAQINALTDLDVSYEQKKMGRTVTSLLFTIRMKPDQKPKEKQAPIDAALIAKKARPGETRDETYQRLKKERGAKRSMAKKPEQMALPECAMPPAKKPADPSVQASLREALATLRTGSRGKVAKV